MCVDSANCDGNCPECRGCVVTPDDLAADEVRLEGRLHKLNGWEAGQMAQQMGRDIRERIKPGWKVKRAVLRLSVYMEKDE